jgi:hypothetical protein
MTKKHALLAIFLATTFLLNAQTQQLNQDSLLFIKTKAEFVKYEQYMVIISKPIMLGCIIYLGESQQENL